MDPFTQRMLEKAEQRSRALGISNASKFPLAEGSAVGAGGDASVGAVVTALASQNQQHHHKQQQQQQQQLQQQKQEQQLQLQTMRSPAQTQTSSSSHASTNTSSMNKLQVVERKPARDAAAAAGGSPNKVLRQFSAVDKENMDLGIEINIMTDKNVEVQVQVEEQETTDDEDGSIQQARPDEPVNQPLAKIRDTSRNRLQRLGALYSNTDDLSSPIHRTEGKFSAEDTGLDTSPKKPKQRYGKLAALANSINQWEDDTAHHALVSSVPPPKPDLPSRRLGQQKQKAPSPPVQAQSSSSAAASSVAATSAAPITTVKTATESQKKTNDVTDSSSESSAKSKTKQLKWDPKVINSLEAQGFQRRESNTAKLAYDYAKEKEEEEKQEVQQQKEEESKPAEKPAVASHKPVVGKLAPSEIFNSVREEEKKPVEKKILSVKPGLVSGRAAAFENKAAGSQPQRPQKDPTELSLKERMQLFEKNKGEALVPKAAFGMAPSINKIRQENAAKKEVSKAPSAAPSSAGSTSSVATKTVTDSKVRDKVAALVANAATISENKIKAEIEKQRQEDMQVLANRFNKQKEIFAKELQQQQEHKSEHRVQTSQPTASTTTTTTPTTQAKVAAPTSGSNFARPPPPPPPPPMAQGGTPTNALSTKRRSPGDVIDDDESKRARKSNDNRLYPALSDFESNESYSDNDNCCTTATPHSGRSTADNALKDHEDDENNCNESFMDSEEDSSAGLGNDSLGREIMQVVQKNDHKQKQQQPGHKQVKEVRYADKDLYYGDSSMNSSEASMGVDDYLDEALDENIDGDDDFTQESEDDENSSRVSRGSKGTTASNSFSFRKTPKRYSNCQTISEENDDYRTPTTTNTTASNGLSSSQPVKSELSVNQDDENMVTLVHTVSFYRRQQTANSNNSTPVRKICREQQVLRSTPMDGSAATAHMQFEPHTPRGGEEENDNYIEDEDAEHSDTESVDDSHIVQDKIKKLLDEVCKQQQVIAQTSQALNLCAATIEFSGSTESVEGERHLLVATHRRQACLDEVQRLRVEKSLRPLGAPKEKGRLTVKEITVPLRQDYIRKLAADTISGHHLVCLLKYNEHVLATKTVPTLPGLLAVKFPDVLQLNNVYADFRITLEIYGMTAQREVLPHEVKYHINLNKKSGVKTPKKKGSDNRLVMPPVQSPAGPNVVRTPALVQYGFAIFSLREIQRTTWTLTQVLGVSPLDGAVHMKVNCELSVSVEYKGFLTMFEDISGFGAWHRRWCHLNGTMLNFWKYPDDEKKKTPMGSIDLYACSSQKITTAPRDICARLNTMLLECERPAKDSDQESLIIVPNGRTTIVRHLLSADTKEEREEWCAYFNKALTLLRAWGPPQ